MKYIKCSNILKKYKSNIVLNNFNFTFTNEYINFLQGANGTGKTTLILCILDFLKYKGIIERNFQKFVFQPEIKQHNKPEYRCRHCYCRCDYIPIFRIIYMAQDF